MLHMNRLIKHIIEGNIEGGEDEKEDINSYWVNLGCGEGKVMEFEERKKKY